MNWPITYPVYVANIPRPAIKMMPGTRPMVARTEGRDRIPREMVSAICEQTKLACPLSALMFAQAMYHDHRPLDPAQSPVFRASIVAILVSEGIVVVVLFSRLGMLLVVAIIATRFERLGRMLSLSDSIAHCGPHLDCDSSRYVRCDGLARVAPMEMRRPEGLCS